MKRLMMTAVALALLTTGAQAGNVTQLYAGGFWKTSHHASNSKGQQMCTIAGNWKFNGANGEAWLKWTNEFGLFMHIGKSNWSFPASEHVPMSIAMEAGVRDGLGLTFIAPKTGQSLIELKVVKDAADKFIEDFASTDRLVITFKEGNEPPWVGKMVGSRAAADAFKSCIARIKVNVTATSPLRQGTTPPEQGMLPVAPEAPKSMPFGDPKASQPFVNGKDAI